MVEVTVGLICRRCAALAMRAKRGRTGALKIAESVAGNDADAHNDEGNADVVHF